MLLKPTRWSNPVVASITTWLIRLTLLALTVAATASHASDEAQEWPEFCLWIAAMIMLSPLSWDHYQVLLLIPYVQVAAAYNRGKAGGAPLTMAIVSYCLTVVVSAVFLSVSVPVANGLPLVGSKWLAPLVLLQLMVPMTA